MARYYTDSHEWIEVQDDFALVGVTEFASKEIGEIILVDLPEVGQTFKKGEVVAVLESTKVAAEVFAPVDLEILELNSQLRNKPNLINESAEREGWIVKVKVSNLTQINELRKI